MATPEEWEEKIMPACRCKMVPYSHKEVGRTLFLGQLMIYQMLRLRMAFDFVHHDG
jgi:hypothetical protein